MEDREKKKITCRSIEGLEADVPRRAIVYGQIGEIIRDSDNLIRDDFDRQKDDDKK